MDDFRISLDVLVGLMLAETLYKPIATRIGRWLLKQADTRWPWIPDWLFEEPSSPRQ